MESAPQPSIFEFETVNKIITFLKEYGWFLLGGIVAAVYIKSNLEPFLQNWKQQREDAEYRKDPDKMMDRLTEIQLARERQQKRWQEQSDKQKKAEEERRLKKKTELEELIKKSQEPGGSHRRGPSNDYMPLSGGGGSSTYRAPKKSKCTGGGCQ